MKNRSGEKIKLASIDELLGVVNEESAMEIEISKIHPFKNHPFKVLDDEKMQDLVESVRINGVLTPVLLRMDQEMIRLSASVEKYGIINPLIVRPIPDGVYEIISGHRRKAAAEKFGYRKVPVIIRVMSDDEAVINMVDSVRP